MPRHVNTDEFDHVTVWQGQELILVAKINTPYLKKLSNPRMSLKVYLETALQEWCEIQGAPEAAP